MNYLTTNIFHQHWSNDATSFQIRLLLAPINFMYIAGFTDEDIMNV